MFYLVAGGMDFRAMLMRKKKPAKKVVVVRIFICINFFLAEFIGIIVKI